MGQVAISIVGSSWGVGMCLSWERAHDARFSRSGNQSKLGKTKAVTLVKVEWQQINLLLN